jgi:hypothetical protein
MRTPDYLATRSPDATDKLTWSLLFDRPLIKEDCQRPERGADNERQAPQESPA